VGCEPKVGFSFSFIGVGVTLEVRLRLYCLVLLGWASVGLSRATGRVFLYNLNSFFSFIGVGVTLEPWVDHEP